MIKRDFLKLLGAGLASIPFAGKLFREGLPEIKAAAKGIARTLPKIEGMPEWFTPLVNKIMKEGKNISPEVKRLEDTVHVRTLKDGDTVFTLTEHPLEGEISVQIKSPRNPHGEPIELQYTKPKKDFDPDTGKTIYEPGEFQVVETEPKSVGHWEDPTFELGEKVTSIDKSAGDIEAAERAVTGKIKNPEKIKERRKIKDQMENNPSDYIQSEYGPGPDYKDYNIPDYARGGIVNFSTGGYPPVEEDNQFGQNIQTVPTGFYFGMNPPVLPTPQPDQEPVSGNLRDFRSMMSNINPQLGYTGVDYGANVSAMMNPYINAPKSYSANAYYGPEQDRYRFGITTIPTIGSKQIMGGYEGPYGNISLGASKDPMGRNFMVNYTHNFADGGQVKTHLTRTIPPVRGPMSQGVETLFKRRYR